MQYNSLLKNSDIHTFKQKIKEENFVFAYPTEAVYGLGCNPFDESAVNRVLTLKHRSKHQHFILIAADWTQITTFIDSKHLSNIQLELVKNSWPGPITWVFPTSSQTPSWLISADNTIALRITAHPLASHLCQLAGHALVSTSANISGHPPCRTFEDTQKIFDHNVDWIIPGETSGLLKPTPIRHVLTGEILRS